MARKKKLVTEDPSSQIEQLKIEIENLTQELKAKKTELKQLEKDKIAYDSYQEYLKQENRKRNCSVVVESGQKFR